MISTPVTQSVSYMRASQINGCSVCVDVHSRQLRKAGETDERLFTLAAWRDTPYFTDAERAALALTEAVTQLGGMDPVPDAIWDDAAGAIQAQVEKLNAEKSPPPFPDDHVH